MQLEQQFIPTAAKFDNVFSKKMKRNRVELVSDFPNDAEVISSLQVGILINTILSWWRYNYNFCACRFIHMDGVR